MKFNQRERERLNTAINIELSEECCLGNPSSEFWNEGHKQHPCDSRLCPEDEIVCAPEQVDIIPRVEQGQG